MSNTPPQGDLGGQRTLQKKWTSFLKAKLVCSMPELNFVFNVVHDVFILKGTDWKDTVIYGVFTSQWSVIWWGRERGEKKKKMQYYNIMHVLKLTFTFPVLISHHPRPPGVMWVCQQFVPTTWPQWKMSSPKASTCRRPQWSSPTPSGCGTMASLLLHVLEQ